MATKGRGPMTKIVDMRNATFEQANRAAIAFVTAKLVESVVGVIYRAGAGEKTVEVDEQGWQLGLRCEPSLRVMIRGCEEKLQDAARNVLRALGYEVRDKGDHLVVLI
jgi:hypothetical protein